MNGHTCHPGYWCVDAPPPDEGYVIFDNILYAWVNIFQSITFTNWTMMMYELQDAVSQLMWIYFVLLIVLVGWFAMNLSVAVLFNLYVAASAQATYYDDEEDSFGEQSEEWSEYEEEEFEVADFATTTEGEAGAADGDGVEGDASMLALQKGVTFSLPTDADSTSSAYYGVTLSASQRNGAAEHRAQSPPEHKLAWQAESQEKAGVLAWIVGSEGGHQSGNDGDDSDEGGTNGVAVVPAPLGAFLDDSLAAAAENMRADLPGTPQRVTRDATGGAVLESAPGAVSLAGRWASWLAGGAQPQTPPQQQQADRLGRTARWARRQRRGWSVQPLCEGLEGAAPLQGQAGGGNGVELLRVIAVSDDDEALHGAGDVGVAAKSKGGRGPLWHAAHDGADGPQEEGGSLHPPGRSSTVGTAGRSRRNSVDAGKGPGRHGRHGMGGSLLAAGEAAPLWQRLRHRLRRLADRAWHAVARGRFRKLCRHASHSATTEELSMLIICTNSVMQAAVWYQMPTNLYNAFESTNTAFTAFFGAEMLLKMYGAGLTAYCSSRMNLFDALVVVVSFAEVGLRSTGGGSDTGGLSVLRSLRILRVFKLARQWKQLNSVITIIGKALASLSYLGLLMFLFMFIFALLGMHLFGYQLFFCDDSGLAGAEPICPPGTPPQECPDLPHCYVPCLLSQNGSWVTYNNLGFGYALDAVNSNDYPYFDSTRFTLGGLCSEYAGGEAFLVDLGHSFRKQGNYDTMLSSLMTIFRTLTFDNWDSHMHNTMAKVSPWAALFHIVVIALGYYILINLVLAILLDRYALETAEQTRREAEELAAVQASAKDKNAAAGGLFSHAVRKMSDNLESFSAVIKNSRVGKLLALEPEHTKAEQVVQVQLTRRMEKMLRQTGSKRGSSFRGGSFRGADSQAAGGGSFRSTSGAATTGSFRGGRPPVAAGNSMRAASFKGAQPPGSFRGGGGPRNSRPSNSTAMEAAAPQPPKATSSMARIAAMMETGADGSSNGAYGAPASAVAKVPKQDSILRNSSVDQLGDDERHHSSWAPFKGRPSAAASESGASEGSRLSHALQRGAALLHLGGGDGAHAVTEAYESQPAQRLTGAGRDGSQHPPNSVNENASTAPRSSHFGTRPSIGGGNSVSGRTAHVAELPRGPSMQQVTNGGQRRTHTGGLRGPSFRTSSASNLRGASFRSTGSSRSNRSGKSSKSVARSIKNDRCRSETAFDLLVAQVAEAKAKSGGLSLSDAGHSRGLASFRQMASTVRDVAGSFRMSSTASVRHSEGGGSRGGSISGGPSFMAEEGLTGTSLFLFSPRSRVRVVLNKVVSHTAFEVVILLCILASSVVLALDKYGLQPGSPTKVAIDRADLAFVVIFAVEAGMKIVVWGLLLDKGAYLRQGWNILDGIIVVAGILSQALQSSSNVRDRTILNAVRTLRALRPLRMAMRLPGMKVVLLSLTSALPGCANVFVVASIMYIVFGILGMNLFSGKLWYCADQNGNMMDPLHYRDGATGGPLAITVDWCNQDGGQHWLLCPAPAGLPTLFRGVSTADGFNSWNCTASGAPLVHNNTKLGAAELWGVTYECEPDWGTTGLTETVTSLCPPVVYTTEWSIPEMYNFDNIGFSLLTLYEMASQESWSDVMYAMANAVGVGQQPVRDANSSAQLYAFIWMWVGSFFLINLFVGCCIEKYHEMRDKLEGNTVLLDEEQEQWVNIHALIINSRPKLHPREPPRGLRRVFFRVATWRPLDALIMAFIVANTLVMAIEHRGISPESELVLQTLNDVFAYIFAAEAFVKVVAFGVRVYLQDSTFDLVVSIISLAGAIASTTSNGNTGFLSILRTLRVVRVFRIIPHAKGLRNLVRTLVYGIPALFNVMSVLLLFYFIYSVIGMTLFGQLQTDQPFCMDRHVNFQDLPTAMLIMIRMSTGENWNCIMHATMRLTTCMLVNDPTSALYGTYLDVDDPALGSIDPALVEDRCAPFHSKGISVVFFCSFMMLCSYVMVNLVVAVLIDVYQNSKTLFDSVITPDHRDQFVEAWAKLDTRASWYIKARNLEKLLMHIDPPLGVQGMAGGRRHEVQRISLTVKIPCHQGGYIHFVEALHGLAARVAHAELPPEEQTTLLMELARRMPALHRAADDVSPHYNVGQYMAALYVQSAVRGYLARHGTAHKKEADKQVGVNPSSRTSLRGRIAAMVRDTVASRRAAALAALRLVLLRPTAARA